MKLDLRKAFDTIICTGLEKVLVSMSFPENFIVWIVACITTSMLFVKVNGTLEGYFPAKSGLRQGDPISPYLFVLSMEVLIACPTNSTATRGFKYHWKDARLAVTHLIFADDILLFSMGDLISVNALMASVNHFLLSQVLR